MTLTADPRGRLVFSVRSGNDDTKTFQFQPIRMVGSGWAILFLRWSGNWASLSLNGRAVSLDAEAPEEEFVLTTPPYPIPQGRLLGQLDLSLAKSEAESLFLATLLDVEQKVAEASRYSLVRAAGLLRQLLLDPTPLVHAVNRNYRKKIEFEVTDFRIQPPETPQAHWVNLDPSRFPGAMTVRVNLNDLLGAPSLVVEGVTATVRDLITACANVKGGIHLGKARTVGGNLLIDWDRAFTLLGDEPSLRAIAGLCRVVVRGLSPLIQEIARRPL